MKSRGVRLRAFLFALVVALAIGNAAIFSNSATAVARMPSFYDGQDFYPLGSLIRKNPDCDRMIVPYHQEDDGLIRSFGLSLPNLLFGLSLDQLLMDEELADPDRLEAVEELSRIEGEFLTNIFPTLIYASFLNNVQFDADKPIEDFATFLDFLDYYGESANSLFRWMTDYYLSMAYHVVQYSHQYSEDVLATATQISEGTLSTLDLWRDNWGNEVGRIYDLYNKAHSTDDNLVIRWRGLEEKEVSVQDVTWGYIREAYDEMNNLTIDDFWSKTDRVDELGQYFARINESDLVSEWVSRRGVLSSNEAKEYYYDNFQTHIGVRDYTGDSQVGAIERYCVSRGRTFNYEAQFDESWDPSWGGRLVDIE